MGSVRELIFLQEFDSLYCNWEESSDELQKALLAKNYSFYLLLSVHVLVNKCRISPPNSMSILGDEVVAEVGEG